MYNKVLIGETPASVDPLTSFVLPAPGLASRPNGRVFSAAIQELHRTNPDSCAFAAARVSFSGRVAPQTCVQRIA
jgi:hypothetical protein